MKEEREQRKEDRKQVEKCKNQQRSQINKAFEHGPVSKEQLYKIQEVLQHPSQYRDRIKQEDHPAK